VAPAHKLDSLCKKARIARPKHSNGRLFGALEVEVGSFLFVTDSDSRAILDLHMDRSH